MKPPASSDSTPPDDRYWKELFDTFVQWGVRDGLQHSEAEDVASEAVARVWKRVQNDGVTSESKELPFLRRAYRWKRIDLARPSWRRRASGKPETVALLDLEPATRDQVDVNARLSELVAALRSRNVRTAEVFQLKSRGFAVSEIAQELRVSSGTVRKDVLAIREVLIAIFDYNG
jgi:RNA polymerase sigma factor (sigma-70 family)